MRCSDVVLMRVIKIRDYDVNSISICMFVSVNYNE